MRWCAQLVLEFNGGLLPMPDGRMLRMFLAKALNCDPMRISKKFVGNSAIGKQVYVISVRPAGSLVLSRLILLLTRD